MCIELVSPDSNERKNKHFRPMMALYVNDESSKMHTCSQHTHIGRQKHIWFWQAVNVISGFFPFQFRFQDGKFRKNRGKLFEIIDRVISNKF